MNILFDTNILLDALTMREPFGEDAAVLFNAVEQSEITGFICANSVTTVFYLAEKTAGREKACRMITLLLELFDVAPVNRTTLEEALEMHFADFEDAVIYHAALAVNADGIVTRNPRDFSGSKLTVYSPSQLIAVMKE